ncbi:hypothetical protein RB195_005533 [Necator americanus]|uniref:Ribosomal RNA-processing protein 40 n=1 Tax=Necator americanus TaxID=51031 RepID=A0ABR1BRB5_NECAM
MEWLLDIFKKNKALDESILIILIDRCENKSHDFLKLMERKHLIPTQQITTQIVERLPRQHQSSLSFVSKMNLKLGGFNYTVVPELFGRNRWIATGDTLVVGYDVAHPGKPTRDEIVRMMPPQRPSVVGFSFNGAAHPECFIGDYHFQTPRREMVEGTILNARFKWMIGLYSKYRGKWPARVLITRDGVSEGQYKMVISDELSAIKEACEEFGRLNGVQSWMPRFTVIIATKRHNSRFFVHDGYTVGNPKAGTIVDTDVVRNDITEFYMQSHRPIQGTAKPTSYQIIVDENDMSADELQSVMLALTFQHQICDSPVSIPEPIYQADEWAKRGKDIWKAYTDRYNVILMKDRGKYVDYPVDFEAMTKRLAFWNTRLENRRLFKLNVKISGLSRQLIMSKICLPGEEITTRIPTDAIKIVGYGIARDPETGSLVARQCGVFRQQDDKCWISVHSKRYVVEKGDRVIGIVTGSMGDFYKLDIGTAENAVISYLSFEGATKRNRPELKIGDVVYAQVVDEFAHTDIELTCVDALSRAKGLGALTGGFLFKTSCSLARRLLSSQSQLLKLLGKDYKFEITVGLNGRIWLKSAIHKDVITIHNIIKWSEYVLECDIPKYVENEVRKSKGFPVTDETLKEEAMETTA